MAKTIKQIHDLVTIAFDKGKTNYWSHEEIDAAVYAAIMDLFRTLKKEYPKTLHSRNFMLPLQRTATITLTAGIGNIPDGFSHEQQLFVVATGKHIPILERGFWDTRKRDPIDVPSTTNPIATIYGDTTGVRKVELYPTTSANPGLLYFQIPTAPSYVTTLNGASQEVYDDTASVDIEFPATLHDIIFEKALASLGLGLQNGQAVQLSQATINKEMKM